MRILHIVDFYYPKLGGLEIAVQRLAEEQVKLGHEVKVITSDIGASDRLREEVINEVEVIRVRSTKLLYDDLTIPLEKPPLVKDVDVIHVHTQNSLFCLKIAQYAKKLGKPLIYQFIAVDYTKEDLRPAIKILGSLYQELIQRKAISLANKVITLNYRDYYLVWRKFNIKPYVVPHGIDERYLKKPKDEHVFKEKHKINTENVVSYVGRLHPSKGIDVLIRAIPLIMREVDDFVVVIAGRGSRFYEERLVKLAKRLGVEHKVKFLGYVSEDEKISLLDSSKILVLPTRHFGEAYPLIIDEAYARGVPVIATRIGALPYRVRHMETGLLIPPVDPLSLAKSIVVLTKNRGLFTRIRENLLRVRESILTWRHVCEKLDKIYGAKN